MEKSRLVLPECAPRLSQLPRLSLTTCHSQGELLDLTQAQWHYLHHVRRQKPGDPLLILDGAGQLWLAQLQGKQVLLETSVQLPSSELPLRIHVGLAVLKGNMLDEVIRQLTELGVGQITPLLTEHSLLQPSPTRQQRWQRIVQEAVEQSERFSIPVLTPPLPWKQWLMDLDQERLLMAVARMHTASIAQVLQKKPLTSSIALAVGPEGGWSAAEIELALAHQAELVSLGSRILRAVTAAPVMTALVAANIESCSSPAQLGRET